MSIPKLNGYEVSGAAAKNCFIVLCHGGGLDGCDHNGKPTGWMNHEDWDISDEVRIKVSRKGHLALVMAFKNECTRVCGYLLREYPKFEGILEQVNQRLPPTKQKTGPLGKFMGLRSAFGSGTRPISDS